MTKLTTIPVADVELLLKKIAFDVNTLTVGDVGQAQALLVKINPPDPTVLGMICDQRDRLGMSSTLRAFWETLYQKALIQEKELKTAKDDVERFKALSGRHHRALTEISNHTTSNGRVATYAEAYDQLRAMARKALDF